MNLRKRGFTLIEVLVVVAIIALLIAILLPSLAQAKAQARMVQCQNNVRQISTAFITYALGDNKGRLPGSTYSVGADWLGRSNYGITPATPWGTGEEPERGVIYRHMGKNKLAYMCPDDDMTVPAPDGASGWPLGKLRAFSFSCNMMINGALTENLQGAHYPLNDMDNMDHRASATRRMTAFNGVPMLIEEDLWRTIAHWPEGGFAMTDGITQRHFKTGPLQGFGSIGFTDTHAGRVRLPALSPDYAGAPPLDWDNQFCQTEMCIRKPGKWVSGQIWNDPVLAASGWNTYGYMDHASDASALGVTH